MMGFKHKHKWRAIRTIWPFKDGYGTYCRGCMSVLDIGLSKEEADRRARKLNQKRIST